jgi:mannose-6-phosphate isomerase
MMMSFTNLTAGSMAPLALDPENFTPLARTPWAGPQIAALFKSLSPKSPERLIGESWEVSCDPAFPSKILGTTETLASFITKNKRSCLSQNLLNRGVENCEILVKLLNAAEPLSLQLHPQDDDASLLPHECGKPESWLVLHAEPNAGIYLGFKQTIDLNELREMLERGTDMTPYLQFIPVKPGDFFEIKPGVVHAVGPGITLLEPQRVLPGKSGKTYRLWDWNRRYLPNGSRDDQHGKARELHIDASLRIMTQNPLFGRELAAACKQTPAVRTLEHGLLSAYPANSYYQVFRFQGTEHRSALEVTVNGGYAVWLQLRGNSTFKGGFGKMEASRGRPYFLPADTFPCQIWNDPDADFACIVPNGATIDWKSAT